MIEERWLPIKDFPKYEISNQSRVRSYQMGYLHFLKLHLWGGYFGVTLYNNKKLSTNKCIHILMLETFIKPQPIGFVANHKDGNKTNNDPSNLEWITKSEDLKHAYKIGLRKTPIGEKSRNAKLKNDEVWLIKRLL